MKPHRLTIFILFLLFLTIPLKAQPEPGKGGIGLLASGTKMIGGDKDDSVISQWYGISLTYFFTSHLGLELNGAMGWDRPRDTTKSGLEGHLTLRPKTPFRTFLYPFSANLKINLNPSSRASTYFLIGAGALIWDLRDVSAENNFIPVPRSGTSIHGTETNALLNIGAGTEIFLSQSVALDLSFRYQQLFGQNQDMSGYGDKNSGNLEPRIGLNFYFGGWKDSDKDGIEDKLDECPLEAEDPDGFEDEDGCPDPDNDMDGIPDLADKAPNQAEDRDGFQDNDGIPDPDNDNDNIPDVKDKCPNEPEDYDGFQDEDGCPDPDNDKDGIADKDDVCPNQPETINDYQDADGCPDEKPKPPLQIIKEETTILTGVTFKPNSETLTADAKLILDLIVKDLKSNPDYKIEISGHTDALGDANYNLQLSRRRALAVLDYLILKGIAPSRMSAWGYGEDRPIAPNDTREGRAKNRRIEIVRIDNVKK